MGFYSLSATWEDAGSRIGFFLVQCMENGPREQKDIVKILSILCYLAILN